MSLRWLACAGVILWVLMMTLPSKSQQSNPSAAASRSAAAQKFALLSDLFMKESLVLSPTGASAAGYHVYHDPTTGKDIELDALLDDMSLESIAKQRAFYAEWRERFRAETPPAALEAEDGADWQLIDDQIGLNLLEFDKIQSYRHNPTVVVELIGNALFLPLTQTYAPARCARRPRPLARTADSQTFESSEAVSHGCRSGLGQHGRR